MIDSSQPSRETLNLVRQLRRSLASSNLPRHFAKLYSQYTLVRAGGKGLQSWREADTLDRLNEAMRLLEAGSIEKKVEGAAWRDTNSWRDSIRRAAELLESLSGPRLNPQQLHLRLLSAAAYQLAGYPARSSSLLHEKTVNDAESSILRFLLNAEFSHLFKAL